MFRLTEKPLQIVERAFPELAVLRDPLLGVLQRFRGQAAAARAPGFLLRNQAGLFEHADVFHYRRQGHAVWLGQLGNGGLAKQEGSQNGAAGRVGQGAEGAIELVGILNHMV